MERLRADLTAMAPDKLEDLNGFGAAIVDGSAEITADRAAQVLDVARRGGTVLVHGMTDKTVGGWAKALGARLELRAINNYYRGRAVRRDWSPLLEGLSMHEMHWHQNTGGDGSSFDLQWRIAEFAKNEIVTDAPGAVNCTHPAVFVSIPLGQGTVLMDEGLWTRPATWSATSRAASPACW